MPGPLSFEDFQRLRQSSQTPEAPQPTAPAPLNFDQFQQLRQADTNYHVGGAVKSATDQFKLVANDYAGGAVGAVSAADSQFANLFMVLDKAAEGLSQTTGLDKGGAFGKVEEWFRNEAKVRAQQASGMSPDRPGVMDDINRFVGSLPVAIPEAAAAVAGAGPVGGFALLGGLSEADKGLAATAKGALVGGLGGKVFQIAAPLGPLARAGAVTSGIAAIESAAGATPKEALMSGATGGVLAGTMGGPGAGRAPAPIPQTPDLGSFVGKDKPRLRGPTAVVGGPVEAETAKAVAERPLVQVTTEARTALGKLDKAPDPTTKVHLGDDRVLNLNLRRIQGPEDFKAMQRELVEQFRPQIDNARRGEITHEETQRMADTLGIRPEDLLKRTRGQAFNAEELTAARVMHQSIAKELFDSANRIKQGGSTEAQKNDLLGLVALFQGSASQALGATAEAGRALSALRITAGPAREQITGIQALMKQFQGTKGREIEAFADMISRLDTPAGMTKTLEQLKRPSGKDVFLEHYINWLIAAPKTSVVNVTSNTAAALWTIPAAYTAGAHSGLSTLVARTAGRPLPERVFMREGTARLWGAAEGFSDGLKIALKTLKTGGAAESENKLEFSRGATQRLGMFVAENKPRLGKALQTYGRFLKLPGDFLLAQDDIFKAIAARQEINALAVRQAAAEGLRGSAFRERVVDLTLNPTDEMHARAHLWAQRQTFTEPLGPTGQHVISFTNSHPVLKVIAPFVKVGTNIFKWAIRNSPLAPAIFNESVSNLRAGGTRQAEEVGRILFGTAMATTAAKLAAAGYMTGSGPKDPESRAAWLIQNQPYSFRLSKEPGSPYNNWTSFSRLEPAATILGVAADYAQLSGHMSQDEMDQVVPLIVLSFRNNVENKTFFTNIAGFVKGLDDPESFGEKFLGGLASGMVPYGPMVAEVAREQDPVLRRVDSILDKVKSRTPGFTDTLPPRRNIWGEPIFLEGGVGPDFISPFYSQKVVPDLATEEAVRTGAQLSKPKASIEGVELNPQERDKLEEISGRLGKMMVDKLVASPGYSQAPKTVQRQLIEELYGEARGIARTQVFSAVLTHDPGRLADVVRKTVKDLLPPQAEARP